MATQSFRIVGYLSPETYAKLREFIERRQLTEAQAIEVILTDYLGTTSTLSDRTLTTSGLTPMDVNRSRVEPAQEATPPDIPTDVSMSLLQLANYLKCNPDELANIQNYPVVFADYTKERDPEGKAWEYEPKSQRYFPVVQ